ncbi:hypothetical protein EXIGLDRAFT_568084, partial [Exidia glandulosa HHB12029]
QGSFWCMVCFAIFVRKHDLKRHMRKHTDSRPFPCHGGCGQSFRRADTRSGH